MHREQSPGLLQGGASTYYHGLDNRGQAGGSSMPPHALSDISNSQSRGSFVCKHEFPKPPPLLDKVDSLELDNTSKTNTINNININKVDNDFLAQGSSNHADIGFWAHSHINIKNGSCWAGGIVNGKGSLLSFEQSHQIRINQHKDTDDCSFIWKDDGNNIMSFNGSYNSRQATISDTRASSSSRFHDESTNFNHQPGNSSYDGILNSDSTVIAADRVQEIGIQEGSLLKRPYTGNQSAQLPKKQCTAVAKDSSAKPRKPASSKDPQRVAAKKRRERISERLRILQELVPNGPKVDLVTMLEKAIGYVKFLQLQVKVLSTDEFWPAQGGKAPEISQVKEAIDAILASQQDRSSS